jgi:hypothetical protein
MIRTKVLWLEQAAPQWEEVVELDVAPRGFPGDALRLAELAAWQMEEGLPLPMPADLILWFEDHGFVVDMLTGSTSRLEPLQQLIDEAAQTDEYESWLEDVDFFRHGC